PTRLVPALCTRLPFRATGAQDRAFAEIEADLAAPHPMRRLLQGDVGSGKTLVALLAALTVIEAGHQVALMAPTELLAEQHLETVRPLAEPLPGRTPIATRLCRESRRDEVYARVREAVAAGHQAYIVYPLVEESEKSSLRAASTMVHELGAGPLNGLRLGLVHGRMKPE